MEIGAPMAALYLLDNPDHYTSHVFTPFYWKNFTSHIEKEWEILNPVDSENDDHEDEGIERLTEQNLQKNEPEDARGEDCIKFRNKGGNFVGKSNTDDYRLRPTQLNTVCLYEWIQCSIKHKLLSHSALDPSLTYFSFLPDHALSDSHIVTCDPRRRSFVVPNFIGPPLPCQDTGDRESYCRAMLTFFQHWRMATDLKHATQTWEEAFNEYEFTDCQRELMRNFNVRYECYDARDDFAANLKKSTHNSDNESDEAEDERGENDHWNDELHDEDYDIAELGPEGKIQQQMLTENQETTLALRKAGWKGANGVDTVLRNGMNLPRIALDHNISATSWNSIITAQKQLLWRRHFQGLSQSDNIIEGERAHEVRNDAYVVPPLFLSKDFVPTQPWWSDVMKNIITKSALNKEQQKAFRIVANHATCVAPDQLLMYLGGMGGTGKSTVIRALEHFFNERQEPYRFVVLAPTGTGAALIGGTTYHSFLGFRTVGGPSSVGDIMERLRAAGYMLLDESSMLAPEDVCCISARCCEALKVYEKPFGGLNVIFAGDFAQLPPPLSPALYSRSVSLHQKPKHTTL
jgi:hypothetical protein